MPEFGAVSHLLRNDLRSLTPDVAWRVSSAIQSAFQPAALPSTLYHHQYVLQLQGAWHTMRTLERDQTVQQSSSCTPGVRSLPAATGRAAQLLVNGMVSTISD